MQTIQKALDPVEAARSGLGDAVKDVITFRGEDRKSTRLNSSHSEISHAVFCLKKKVPRVFNDSFAYLKGEIQSRVSGKTLFELLDNSERMEIVIKTATVDAHQSVEAAVTGLP